MNEQINQIIDSISNDIITYAQDLIKFPSKTGYEEKAQKHTKKIMEHLGAHNTDMWVPDYNELKNHKAFVSARTDFSGSPNLAGVWKGVGGGRSLILSSHIDVVPEGDPLGWTYPPFEGVIDNGILYGRGVSDMKSTMAAMFGAIIAIKKMGLNLMGDLTIISSVEEETGASGALSAVLRGYKADAAIMPEPTGFNVCPAQQGGARFKIIVKGKSAHAGQRYMGVSALDKTDSVRAGIAKYETYLNEKYMSPFYAGVEMPFTINIGYLKCGDWFCTVPETAFIEGRMAIPPGLTIEGAIKNLREFIDDEIKDDPWLTQNKPEIDLYDCWWGPAQIEQDHPITQTTHKAYENYFGHAPKIAGTAWGTDGRMFTEFGNTPSLVFGPGTSAHCPDEFLKIEDLISYTKILTRIIIDWCGIK